MDVYTARMEELLWNIEEKLKEIPYIDKLMGIKGIGLAIVSNSSGKHKGENRISLDQQ